MNLERIDRAVNAMFSRLNAGHRKGPRFYYNQVNDIRGAAFGIMEKKPVAEPGQSRYHDHGHITFQQLRMIESTSTSDDEIVERIIQLIIHKNDTTVQRTQPTFSTIDVERIVQEKLAEALRKFQEGSMPINTPEKVAAAVAREAVLEETVGEEPDPEPKAKFRGLQHKPRKTVKEYQQIKDEDNKVWEDRAKLMGIASPVYRSRDGRIDGRWVRKAQKLWDEHIAAGAV